MDSVASSGVFWPGSGSLGGDGGADLVFFRAEAGQRLDEGCVAVAEEAEQEVLGADVVVAVCDRFVEDGVPYSPGLRGDRCLSGLGLRLAVAGDVLGLLADRFLADPEPLEGLDGDAVVLAGQA